MRKLTMTLTAATLMLGTMAIATNAQTQAPGARELPRAAQERHAARQAGGL
jgi:hypothetical protein